MIESSQLLGTWVSAQPEETHNADGSTMFFKREFTFTDGNNWSLKFAGFGDPAQTFSLFSGYVEGTYEIGQPSATVEGANEADFHFSKKLFTADYEAILGYFNSATDGQWVAGVERDVTESGCPFLPSVAVAPTEYDLLKLDGENLYMGARTSDLSQARAPQLTEFALVRK